MAYVVSGECLDVLDRTCVDVCPVDCIYEGGRKAYIQPLECVDCGACEPVCPVQAIHYVDDVADEQVVHIADNDLFFSQVLPGRAEPLGMPGGSRDVGAVGVDTAYVTALPPNPST